MDYDKLVFDKENPLEWVDALVGIHRDILTELHSVLPSELDGNVRLLISRLFHSFKTKDERLANVCLLGALLCKIFKTSPIETPIETPETSAETEPIIIKFPKRSKRKTESVT